MSQLLERNAKPLPKTEKQGVRVLLFAFVLSATFLLSGSSVHASTVTYTPANLTLDSTSTIYGGSDLQVNSGTLLLNFNRPAPDAFHAGYWIPGSTTATSTDLSSHANNGAFVVPFSVATSSWWVASS